jgi:hypothetical protein
MSASFTDILSYSKETGIVIPQTSDVKENIQNAMFEIFGSGFDTNEETTNGRLIEALTLLTKNAIGVTAQNINTLNLNTASGKQLDDYASFFGITRLPATKSRFVVGVNAKKSLKINAGTRLKDANGNYYKVVSYYGDYPVDTPQGTSVATGIVDGIYVHIGAGVGDSNALGYGYAEAEEYGPIFPQGNDWMEGSGATGIPYLYLVSTNSDVNQIFVDGVGYSNDTFLPIGPSTIGRLEESDFELRNRIKEARDFGGSSTLAIANAIWKTCPDLRTVRVISNDDSNRKELYGIELLPNSIFIAVSGALSLEETIINDTVRKNIAKAIFKTKAAGVAYTDPSMTSDINGKVIGGTAVGTIKAGLTINNNDVPRAKSWRKNVIQIKDISTGIEHNVVFYEALAKSFSIHCNVKINGFTGESVEKEISKVINSYVGGKIDTLTPDELSLVVTANIPGIFITKMDFFVGYTDPSAGSDYVNEITEITPNANEVLIPTYIDVDVI